MRASAKSARSQAQDADRLQRPKTSVERYVTPSGRTTRFWAILVDGELLAVVVYKKGAAEILKRLNKN